MAKSKHKKHKVKNRQLRRRALGAKARNGGRNGREKASGLPLASCRVTSGWEESGTAIVVVARRRPNGHFRCACFYVDLWGLGIRDCFMMEDCDSRELDRRLEVLTQGLRASFEACTETLAQQLVWGGFYYGRQNGFRPPREFSQCRRLLPSLEENEVQWEYFGKEGTPMIIGDYDDLLQRSGGRFDPDSCDGHFIVGLEADSLEEDLDHQWQALLEEDEDLPPDKDKLLFIRGTYLGEDFQWLHDELIRWEDLDCLEVDPEQQYARFHWTRAYPENHWNPLSRMLPGARQSLGDVTIEENTLTVEVKGKSWMLIMDSRLMETLGPKLLRGPLDIQDPLELLNSQYSEEALPAD